MSSPIKVTVALNAMGQVAATSMLHLTRSETTSGMVAYLGQTLVEVEVTASVADMDPDKFLAHFAEHARVKAAIAHLTAPRTSGQEITSGTV